MTTSNGTGKNEESNDIVTKHIWEISMLSRYKYHQADMMLFEVILPK